MTPEVRSALFVGGGIFAFGFALGLLFGFQHSFGIAFGSGLGAAVYQFTKEKYDLNARIRPLLDFIATNRRVAAMVALVGVGGVYLLSPPATPNSRCLGAVADLDKLYKKTHPTALQTRIEQRIADARADCEAGKFQEAGKALADAKLACFVSGGCLVNGHGTF